MDGAQLNAELGRPHHNFFLDKPFCDPADRRGTIETVHACIRHRVGARTLRSSAFPTN
ncbi:protein of unknown function [Hyphomicrobium sp. 1Nfss2.1]